MIKFDLEKYIENLKINKEDLEQKEKKLRNIFLYVCVLLNAILFYIFYFYYFKKIVSYIIRKNEIKDELIFGVSLFFNGLILIVVISAILLFCFVLNHCFETIYLKKLNYKINSLHEDNYEIKENLFYTLRKYYFPKNKKYSTLFENVLNNFYKNDENIFLEWLDNKKITLKTLYIKMIEKKEVKFTLLKGIDEIYDVGIKNIDLKNIELEKEREEENKKTEKIKEEIKHYFNEE